jgi:hypothetical protein
VSGGGGGGAGAGAGGRGPKLGRREGPAACGLADDRLKTRLLAGFALRLEMIMHEHAQFNPVTRHARGARGVRGFAESDAGEHGTHGR